MKTAEKENTKQINEERDKNDKRANFMQEEGSDGDNQEVFTVYHMKACDMTMYNMNEETVIPSEEPVLKELKVNGKSSS